MYIEVGGNNNIKVDTNTINDTQLLLTGILVNCTTAKPAGSNSYSASINGNHITGCNQGISVQGDQNPNASVINNVVTDSKWIAINLNTNASTYSVTINNNTVNFDKPNVGEREGIYTWSWSNSTGQKTPITNNTINYTAAANGGTSFDAALYIGVNYINFTSNKVNGNSIKAKNGTEVFAITSMGNPFTGITYNSNTMAGSTVDLANLTFTSKLNDIDN